MNNILITGAAGMIGYNLCKHLLHKYHIVALDDYKQLHGTHSVYAQRASILEYTPGITFVHGNIADSALIKKLCEEHDFTCVIHLAAYAGVKFSFENPDLVKANNVDGFEILIDTLLKTLPDVRILYASSSSVYGNDALTASGETDDLHPISPYAQSKLQNELYAANYQNITGMRFFTVYGELPRPDMLVHKILHSIETQQPITLYKQGQMRRDFTYCGDISVVIENMIHQSSLDAVYNIGAGNPYTLLQLVQICEDILQQQAHIQLVDTHPVYDPLNTFADNRKVLSIMPPDFKFTDLHQGLKVFQF